MPDRRTFLCGLAALPFAGGSVAILGRSTAATALPAAFDPAAFLADLTAAGYGVTAYRSVPCAGYGEISKPSYYIEPPERDGFGDDYSAIMARWTGAMKACPDHVERVTAEVFKQCREAAA